MVLAESQSARYDAIISYNIEFNFHQYLTTFGSAQVVVPKFVPVGRLRAWADGITNVCVVQLFPTYWCLILSTDWIAFHSQPVAIILLHIIGQI